MSSFSEYIPNKYPALKIEKKLESNLIKKANFIKKKILLLSRKL